MPALVTLLVTGYQLGAVSLWRDEAYSIEAASRGVGQIFALADHTDAVNSPYYLLLHLVIAAGGTSAAVVRLPCVLAMTVTAAMTAAVGRRLARLAALPAPALTGAVAGLFFAAAPMVTRYAQEARSYAFVAMLATTATWLLLRALAGRGWGWWAGYGAAILLAGLFNLLSLLLVAAHAVTLLVIRMRRPAPGAARLPVRLGRWLAAAGAAGVALSPLLVAGYLQRGQIGWLGRPGLGSALGLAVSFAGSRLLLIPVAVVALAGVAAGLAPRPAVQVPPAAVALPWLVVPPLILLAVSQVRPVYDARYVVYCLPALALLCAAGLSWLTRLTWLAAGRWLSPFAPPVAQPGAGPVAQPGAGPVAQPGAGPVAQPGAGPVAQPGIGPAAGHVPGVAWLPALVIGVGLAGLLVAPQQQIRTGSSRPDNLRRGSAIVAAHERPGDAVFYLPPNMRSLGLGYPAPYRRLRDVTLAKSPVAAANLIGTTVRPRVLRRRMAGVTRVWVVTGSASHHLPAPATPLEKTELALISGWRLAGRWSAGDVGLRLYVRG